MINQVKQVPAAPGTIFEVAEQSGDWMRVLLGEEASAWMISSAQGMSLLRPTRRELYVMDPAVRGRTEISPARQCVCCYRNQERRNAARSVISSNDVCRVASGVRLPAKRCMFWT